MKYENGHLDVGQTFDLAANLLEEGAGPAQRSALYKMVASLPGVTLDGPTVTDITYKQGIGVSVDVDGARRELVFDPTTSSVLEERNTVGPNWPTSLPSPQSGNPSTPSAVAHRFWRTRCSKALQSCHLPPNRYKCLSARSCCLCRSVHRAIEGPNAQIDGYRGQAQNRQYASIRQPRMPWWDNRSWQRKGHSCSICRGANTMRARGYEEIRIDASSTEEIARSTGRLYERMRARQSRAEPLETTGVDHWGWATSSISGMVPSPSVSFPMWPFRSERSYTRSSGCASTATTSTKSTRRGGKPRRRSA